MNFTPLQVYEHVTFHYMGPDNVLVIGTFACPVGHSVGIPVELRITSPAAAAGTWSAVTVAAYPTIDTFGYVTFWLPLWRTTVCGDEISYDVRGQCGGVFTPWETFTAVGRLFPLRASPSRYGLTGSSASMTSWKRTAGSFERSATAFGCWSTYPRAIRPGLSRPSKMSLPG
jgi:hypothetical protein